MPWTWVSWKNIWTENWVDRCFYAVFYWTHCYNGRQSNVGKWIKGLHVNFTEVIHFWLNWLDCFKLSHCYRKCQYNFFNSFKTGKDNPIWSFSGKCHRYFLIWIIFQRAINLELTCLWQDLCRRAVCLNQQKWDFYKQLQIIFFHTMYDADFIQTIFVLTEFPPLQP